MWNFFVVFKNDKDQIHVNWNNSQLLEKKINDYLKNENNCPEKDLGDIRRNIVKDIIKYYLEKFCENENNISPNEKFFKKAYDKYNSNKWKPTNFFNFIEEKNIHIYTLNYDPLIYFQLLKLTNRFDGFVSRKNNGEDGFLETHCNGNDKLDFRKQEYYVCKLQKELELKSKIYFMHGTWFILENNDDEIKKIKIDDDISLDTLIGDVERPFVILEDRWRVKESLIYSNPYWTHCAKSLQSEKDELLIFGVSFSMDHHILKILDKSLFERIYICYLSENDKASIMNKLQNSDLKNLKKKNIEFIQVAENIIWEEILPST